MDFNTAEELIKLCESGLSIADAMRKRETVLGETDADTVEEKMKKALGIMRDSAHKPIETYFPTTGGLIGGEASKHCSGVPPIIAVAIAAAIADDEPISAWQPACAPETLAFFISR